MAEGAPEDPLDPEESSVTSELARFVSVANVVWNIRRWCEKAYGNGNVSPSFVAHMREQMKSRDRRALPSEADRLLRVAWQTELAGRVPEAFDEPVLRRVAALTLPVQAYYSMFNALRALSRARGSAIDAHSAMHKDFGENAVKELPLPWSVTLEGDAERLDDCEVDPRDFVAPSSFNLMERDHEAEGYVFAALRMTRRWKWENKRSEWLRTARRPPLGLRYKRLPKGKPAELMVGLRRTTLFDFMYELRCRAHYQTADEYASDFGDDIVDRFHHGMVFLAHSGLLLVEYQIASYVGFDALAEAAGRWSAAPRALGEWATSTLDERLAAIEGYGGV